MSFNLSNDDFPTQFQTICIPAINAPARVNILLLMHGIGDTSESFATLGRSMQLRDTVCLALQGPKPLPFDLGGFHWGDDIQFDHASGDLDLAAPVQASACSLEEEVIWGVLVQKYGFDADRLFLLGSGQGASTALAVCSRFETRRGRRLGGVISVGGPLLEDATASKEGHQTPVLVLGGSSQSMITGTALRELKRGFEDVVYHKFDRPTDAMPRRKEEMWPIMQFLGKRLLMESIETS